jgi:hypothetical protein
MQYSKAICSGKTSLKIKISGSWLSPAEGGGKINCRPAKSLLTRFSSWHANGIKPFGWFARSRSPCFQQRHLLRQVPPNSHRKKLVNGGGIAPSSFIQHFCINIMSCQGGGNSNFPPSPIFLHSKDCHPWTRSAARKHSHVHRAQQPRTRVQHSNSTDTLKCTNNR